MVKLSDISAHISASKGEKIYIHSNTARALASTWWLRSIRQDSREIAFYYPCSGLLGWIDGYGYYVRKRTPNAL